MTLRTDIDIVKESAVMANTEPVDNDDGTVTITLTQQKATQFRKAFKKLTTAEDPHPGMSL